MQAPYHQYYRRLPAPHGIYPSISSDSFLGGLFRISVRFLVSIACDASPSKRVRGQRSSRAGGTTYNERGFQTACVAVNVCYILHVRRI